MTMEFDVLTVLLFREGKITEAKTEWYGFGDAYGEVSIRIEHTKGIVSVKECDNCNNLCRKVCKAMYANGDYDLYVIS